MERLFVLKTLSRTQRATKVKKFVGFSLKPLRCRDPALPPLYGHAYSRPFFYACFSCTRMRISRHAHDTPPRVQHFSAFHSLCICLREMLFKKRPWIVSNCACSRCTDGACACARQVWQKVVDDIRLPVHTVSFTDLVRACRDAAGCVRFYYHPCQFVCESRYCSHNIR